jgi:hypothetical protein
MAGPSVEFRSNKHRLDFVSQIVNNKERVILYLQRHQTAFGEPTGELH